MKVFVCRQPGRGYDGAEVELDDIFNLHWDTITGGVQVNLGRYFPMGYITWETLEAADGYIACSGRHNYDFYGIKVCVLKSGLSKKEWQVVLERCGKRPDPIWRISPYCTTRILEILKENGGKMERGQLRDQLKSERYNPNTIRADFKKMSADGRIVLVGSNFSSKQIITLAEKQE